MLLHSSSELYSSSLLALWYSSYPPTLLHSSASYRRGHWLQYYLPHWSSIAIMSGNNPICPSTSISNFTHRFAVCFYIVLIYLESTASTDKMLGQNLLLKGSFFMSGENLVGQFPCCTEHFGLCWILFFSIRGAWRSWFLRRIGKRLCSLDEYQCKVFVLEQAKKVISTSIPDRY